MRPCKADQQFCVVGLIIAWRSVGPFARDLSLQMSGDCTSFLCVFPKLSTDLRLSLWKPKFWLCDVLVDTELTVHCVPFYCLYFQSSLPLGLGPPWHTLEWSRLPCHGGRGTPACLLRTRRGARGVCVFHVHMSSFQHSWLKTGPPMGSSVSEGLPFSLSSDYIYLSLFWVVSARLSALCLSILW